MKIHDLSEYLSKEKSMIVLGNNSYEVDESLNAFLKLDALTQNQSNMSGKDYFEKYLEISLGKANTKSLIALNLPMSAYRAIMDEIGCIFTGDEGEDDSESV